MESLWPVPIGPCLNNTYQLSILPTTEILLMPVCQKPALLSKLLPESGKCHSKKKLNVSKIQATHLLFDMQDRQEKARRSVKSENQVIIPTGPPVRGAVLVESSHTDFQRHCLISQGTTGYLPDPWTQLQRLPGGITSTLMMMVTRSRKFQTKTSQLGLRKKKEIEK